MSQKPTIDQAKSVLLSLDSRELHQQLQMVEQERSALIARLRAAKARERVERRQDRGASRDN